MNLFIKIDYKSRDRAVELREREKNVGIFFKENIDRNWKVFRQPS